MVEKSYSLAEIATLTESHLEGNPDHKISRVASLHSADDSAASFFAPSRLDKSRFDTDYETTKAGAIFIRSDAKRQPDKNYLICSDPSRAFERFLEELMKGEDTLSYYTDIHPTAVIHPSVKLAEGVSIGPYAVLDLGVTIGKNTFIGSHCYLGPKVIIGESCILHPHCTIRERSQLGNEVILQPGVVIGGCGFGYTTDAKGKHHKLKQLGIVVLEDKVEVGAGTTIDRARFGETRIGKGTIIDNQVQIAHGVQIGEDNILVAQTGIAGSTTTGKRVVMAGKVGVNGHIHIADNVIITAYSAVSKSLLEPGAYSGRPAEPAAKYNRKSVYLRNIETYVDAIKELKSELQALKTQIQEASEYPLR